MLHRFVVEGRIAELTNKYSATLLQMGKYRLIIIMHINNFVIYIRLITFSFIIPACSDIT